MRELCWRGCLQVRATHLHRSLSADRFYEASAELPPRGRSGPAPSRPSGRGPTPPREGAKSVTHWAGGGGRAPAGLVRSAPAEAVPSPLTPDCPLRRLRSVPLCLPTRGCRGRSDRASRGPRLPRAGNGAPWLQPLSEHRCGAGGGVCPLLLPRAATWPSRAASPEPPARLKAPPPGSPRRRRRHLAGRWGRGRAGDREGEGRGQLPAGPLGDSEWGGWAQRRARERAGGRKLRSWVRVRLTRERDLLISSDKLSGFFFFFLSQKGVLGIVNYIFSGGRRIAVPFTH